MLDTQQLDPPSAPSTAPPSGAAAPGAEHADRPERPRRAPGGPALGIAIGALVVALVGLALALVALAVLFGDLAGWGAGWGHDDPWMSDLAAQPLFDGTTDAIEVTGGGSAYEFEAAAGQLLRVEVEQVAGGLYPHLELVDDRGWFLAYAGDDGFAPPADPDGPTAQLWHRFDETGTFQLFLYADGDGEGVLTAELHDIDGPGEPVLATEGMFPDEDGGAPIFEFEGRAGQLAIISMEADSPGRLDPFVRLYGPGSELIGVDDDGGRDLDARLTTRLPVDGRYEIEADAYEAYATAGRAQRFTLTVELIDLD
jgi:hypothetical protein